MLFDEIDESLPLDSCILDTQILDDFKTLEWESDDSRDHYLRQLGNAFIYNLEGHNVPVDFVKYFNGGCRNGLQSFINAPVIGGVFAAARLYRIRRSEPLLWHVLSYPLQVVDSIPPHLIYEIGIYDTDSKPFSTVSFAYAPRKITFTSVASRFYGNDVAAVLRLYPDQLVNMRNEDGTTMAYTLLEGSFNSVDAAFISSKLRVTRQDIDFIQKHVDDILDHINFLNLTAVYDTVMQWRVASSVLRLLRKPCSEAAYNPKCAKMATTFEDVFFNNDTDELALNPCRDLVLSFLGGKRYQFSHMLEYKIKEFIARL